MPEYEAMFKYDVHPVSSIADGGVVVCGPEPPYCCSGPSLLMSGCGSDSAAPPRWVCLLHSLAARWRVRLPDVEHNVNKM